MDTHPTDHPVQEKALRAMPGMPALIAFILLYLAGIAAIIFGVVILGRHGSGPLGLTCLILGILYTIFGWIPFCGIKVVAPQEALVFTLFGKYLGTLRGAGIYAVNPFVVAVNPTVGSGLATGTEDQNPIAALNKTAPKTTKPTVSRAISLKAMTLNNNRQKVNDKIGNPIEIGIVVIWRVVDTARAVFNVDNYKAYLSIQCDTALRDIARMYPYDISEEGDEKSLRGSSLEVAARLQAELQSRVDTAGLQIIDARITHLAYSPEIAAVMLQRQQASAIIAARKMIVDGAVDMVEMALEKLSEKNITHLDEERKAAMVSNLLVVLCGNKDTQPVVNTGTIY